MNWNKPIMVNGKVFESSASAYEALKDFKGEIEIKLNFKEIVTGRITQNSVANTPQKDETEIYRIKVKKYMTEKSVPAFDFMKKWNKNIPMPFVIMYGTILEETKGMYKMKLHARMEKDSVSCMHCGRELTNIVSRNYGIGPICGEHLNIAPVKDLEEFKRREDEIRKAIEAVEWEGYVVKSAITEKTVVERIQRKESA